MAPRHRHRLGGNLEAELHALPEDTSEQARADVRAAWQKRHDAVIGAGGLHIIGTERHESRRIDNQLRAAPAARAIRLEPLLSVDGRQPDAHLWRSDPHQALAADAG